MLPRAEAPADFEERLARKLAGGTRRGVFHSLNLRRYAVPGLALLLVGALTTVMYFTRFNTTQEIGVPSGDTLTPPPVDSRPEGAVPKDASRALPAPVDDESLPEAQDRRSDEVTRPPADARSEPSALERMKMGKTAPGRPMMIESIVPNSAVPVDSLAPEDTVAVDSVLSVPDSVSTEPDALPDTVRIRKPY